MARSSLHAEPARAEVVLQPHPTSVSDARALVAELVSAAGRDDLHDDAVLLVSEVVTNALIHAGSQIRVSVVVGHQGLRVEVGDDSPHHPALRHYADLAGTGRGVAFMVELATDWGVTPDGSGKTVWFELGSTAGGARARGDRPQLGRADSDLLQSADRDAPTAAASAETDSSLRVQLLMTPLLLHQAWREHAETLLREHLLACLDGASEPAASQVDEDPIQVHANAADAIAQLEEQVPVAEIDPDPEKLMEDVTEPGVSVPELWLRIPQTSVPHFTTLERVIEQALLLADSGRSMGPRTQPEIGAFRRWVCRQVRDQAAGKPPVPWSMERETGHPPPARMSGTGLAEIWRSEEHLIAADETDQIVAASGPAAQLLGYAAAEDLIGLRLVTIIPPRFRQAHIAGFTLHHLVGRSPMLGRSVDVPALRRNGTEVSVTLEITPRSAPDGVVFFVGRMVPATLR